MKNNCEKPVIIDEIDKLFQENYEEMEVRVSLIEDDIPEDKILT